MLIQCNMSDLYCYVLNIFLSHNSLLVSFTLCKCNLLCLQLVHAYRVQGQGYNVILRHIGDLSPHLHETYRKQYQWAYPLNSCHNTCEQWLLEQLVGQKCHFLDSYCYLINAISAQLSCSKLQYRLVLKEQINFLV